MKFKNSNFNKYIGEGWWRNSILYSVGIMKVQFHHYTLKITYYNIRFFFEKRYEDDSIFAKRLKAIVCNTITV